MNCHAHANSRRTNDHLKRDMGNEFPGPKGAISNLKSGSGYAEAASGCERTNQVNVVIDAIHHAPFSWSS